MFLVGQMNYLSALSNSSCAFCWVRQHSEINLLICIRRKSDTGEVLNAVKTQVQISVLKSASEVKIKTTISPSLGLI